MADTQKSKSRSGEWVERLPAILKVMNNGVTRLTGKTPASSIKLKEITTQDVTYNRPVGLSEKRLSPLVQVRYLLGPVRPRAGKGAEPLILYGAWGSMIYRVVSSHLANQCCII